MLTLQLCHQYFFCLCIGWIGKSCEVVITVVINVVVCNFVHSSKEVLLSFYLPMFTIVDFNEVSWLFFVYNHSFPLHTGCCTYLFQWFL